MRTDGVSVLIYNWWQENKDQVLDVIKQYDHLNSVRIPAMIDGVLNEIEYTDGRIRIYATVAVGDVWDTGWHDTSVYCDETKKVLVLEEMI